VPRRMRPFEPPLGPPTTSDPAFLQVHLKKDRDSHKAVCREEPVACKLCDTVVRRAGMEEHLADPARAGGHMMALVEQVRGFGGACCELGLS
jgi:hypothetical protein